jgi:hypothetical protein
MDSSFSEVADYRLDNRPAFEPRQGHISHHRCVQTGSGAHPASHPLGTEGKAVRSMNLTIGL